MKLSFLGFIFLLMFFSKQALACLPAPITQDQVLDNAAFIGIVKIINIEPITYDKVDFQTRLLKKAIGPNLKITVAPLKAYKGEIANLAIVYESTNNCSFKKLDVGGSGERIVIHSKDGKNFFADSYLYSAVKGKTWDSLRANAIPLEGFSHIDDECRNKGGTLTVSYDHDVTCEYPENKR